MTLVIGLIAGLAGVGLGVFIGGLNRAAARPRPRPPAVPLPMQKCADPTCSICGDPLIGWRP